MIPYKLRPYTKADFDFVYQIKKEAYKHYIEKFWGSWDEEKQRFLFADFIKKVQNSLSIIVYKNKPIGIYHGETIDKNTYEIGNIIIASEHQGKGIGKDILLNKIKKYSKLKVCLRVFKGNPAVELYKKLGFVVVDETQTHYLMEHISTNNTKPQK